MDKNGTRAPSRRLFDWVVVNLMDPYLGKERNVKTDNFFTSCGLAKQLRQKKTSIVRTVNKVRIGLPPSAKTTQATRYSSVPMNANDVATLSTNAIQKKMYMFLAFDMPVGVDSSEKRKLDLL